MPSPIDSSRLELKPFSKPNKEKKDPISFDEQRKKKPLTKEVEEESLRALKEALKKHKKGADTASIAQEQTTFQKNLLATQSAKIESLKASLEATTLYSKLADRLIHMEKNGIAETTLTLGNHAFFTLTEYSTAPKLFNIQFCATPEAIAFFELHAASLANALNQKHFKFGIHRIDTSILTEKNKRLIEEVTAKEDDE